MNELDIQIHIQRLKHLQDEASNKRLIQSLNKQSGKNTSLRERLGRGLLNAGEQLIKR